MTSWDCCRPPKSLRTLVTAGMPPGQLGNAGLVASLRQIGVPLAQIRLIQRLEPEAAAAQVGAYSGAEADRADLLVDQQVPGARASHFVPQQLQFADLDTVDHRICRSSSASLSSISGLSLRTIGALKAGS